MPRFLYLTSILILLLVSKTCYSQCTPASADNCDEANVLCSLNELNDYTCSNTEYSNPTGCSPLCPSGGGAHNTSWWAFVTSGGNICITWTVSNCSVNGTGIQFGVLGDCSCGEFLFCESNCSGPGIKQLCGELSPCKTYYLFIDGCTGDVCDIRLNTSGGGPPILPPLGNIAGPLNLCKGACNVNFNIALLGNEDCKPIWEWTLDGIDLDLNRNEIFLDFPDEGDFVICATAIVGNPNSGSICDQDGPRCITTRVRNKNPISILRNLCAESVPYNWNGILILSDTIAQNSFRINKDCCNQDSIIDFRIIYSDSLGCKNTNYAQGLVYYDKNRDNFYNTGETILSNYLLSSSPANYSTFSHSKGYSILLERNSSNIVKLFFQPSPFTTVSPSEYTINVGNTYGKVPGSYNFAIQIADYLDLEAQIACSRARPGRIVISTLRINNLGTLVAGSGRVEMDFPIGWTIVKSDPSNYTQTNNTLSWSITNPIQINSWKSFRVEFMVPTTATLGTPYQLAGRVINQKDVIPNNNEIICKDEIMASFDPNDKLAQSSKISFVEGEYGEFVYTIRFQNTGNDTAFDIRIHDTIPLQLDPTSIRVVNASHPYSLEMPKLRYFIVHFPNIMLPDSTVDRVGSNGFVQFAIRPKNKLEVGSRILNSASIYFDYNPPVKTNYAFTEIVKPNSIDEAYNNNIIVYPNPFSNEILVNASDKLNTELSHFEIISLYGKVVMRKNIKSLPFWIQTTTLQSGSYILNIYKGKKLMDSSRIIKI